MPDELPQTEKDALMTNDELIQDFLEGLIETDNEAREPENIDPYFRHLPADQVGGIQFWQLQQCVAELADCLQARSADLDAIEKKWGKHEEWWGRYLSAAAVSYVREAATYAEENGDAEEFAMDFYFSFISENPRD